MSAQALTEQLTTIRIPKIGSLFEGGIYAGILRGVDGAPDEHLILMDGDVEMTWAEATEWAKGQGIGAELPSRRAQALLFANLPEQFEADWYWSNTQPEGNSVSAWLQDFSAGHQYYNHKSSLIRARAVRRLVI